MDDLDRLYRRLVQNIRTQRPEYLQIPFTIQELYEQLVPYRHNRRELAIETNQDYETAVARLLAGERDYVHADPTVRDALSRELSSPTGDHGMFKEFARSQVSLVQGTTTHTTPTARHTPAPDTTVPATAVAPTAETPLSTTLPPSLAAELATGISGVTPVAAFDAMPDAGQTSSGNIPSTTPSGANASETVPSLLSSLQRVDVPTGCRFCGGTLPDGRDVNYCPHCGENLKTKRCPACGAEMDTAWNFCVTCGRRSA